MRRTLTLLLAVVAALCRAEFTQRSGVLSLLAGKPVFYKCRVDERFARGVIRSVLQLGEGLQASDPRRTELESQHARVQAQLTQFLQVRRHQAVGSPSSASRPSASRSRPRSGWA